MKIFQTHTGCYCVRFLVREIDEAAGWCDRFSTHLVQKNGGRIDDRIMYLQRIAYRAFDRYLPPIYWCRQHGLRAQVIADHGRSGYTLVFERYEDAFFFLLRWS